MAKDGVVSIAIDYKYELDQMIRDYESALTEMASSDKLSKGMKIQFDNTITELKRFKADMEKSFSNLSIGKVDKNSFKAFKQTVNKNFESVRAEIDNLNLAVSTINSQIKILGNGVDISKISSQFKDFQDYVQNTNNAIDTMIKKLGGQGVSLISFDDSVVYQAKSQIKEINKLLKSTDEFSDAKGSKYELFDTDQAQAELDVLARDLKNTLELIEKSESKLSNFNKNSIGFKKTINQINILKLKAADLHDSIQQLMDIPDKTGEYTFGDSILISDDDVDKKVSEYGKIIKGTLDEIRESAIKTREELEEIVTPISSKTASAKISDKLNPNSAELVSGVTIETTSSELWKKLSSILEDLQNDLNKNPVVAPVKLVVAPNAVSSDQKGEVGAISKSYSKKYQRELAKTGEDAVIDLEGVYKKTFTSIMDEAVSYSKGTISKIQNIFESSPIKLHFDFNEEEFKKISDTLLSSDSGKKIDITGQITESKKEVNELAEKLTEVNELLNSADSKDFSFKGFDKFAEEISKSLGQLTELQSMLKTLQNIESTLARASGVSSVTDIETQLQNVSKLIDNSIKLDGAFRKNANIDKLASEYNKYLNMGGTNELSSIGKVGKLENSKNIIDVILSKVKELNSQNVDTSSVDKADDELKSVSSTLDDVISRLDHMINLTRDIGNTFYKMFKDASVSDLDKQWSSIESKFKSIADESGKINLSKQKKDIQELVEMYQKYSNAGGIKTSFDLTDNAETIKKINKVYEQMSSKKDAFPGSSTDTKSETEGMERTEKATEEAVQAKKDFSTANKGVQSSIDGSENPLKVEAELMELVAKSVREAADAKKEFVEANKLVKASADESDSGMSKDDAEKQKVTYQELSDTIKRYAKVSERVAKGTSLDGDINEIDRLKEKISNLQKEPILSSAQIQESERQLTKLHDKISDIEKQIAKTNQQKIDNDLLDIRDNATKKLSTYTNASRYTPEFIERVSSKITEIGQLDITKPEDVARLKAIDGEIKEISDASQDLTNRLIKQGSKISDIVSQMKIFKSQNTNMSSSQKQTLDEMISYAEGLEKAGRTAGKEFDDLRASFSAFKADVAETGNMGKNFLSQIGNRLSDMNSKFVAQFLSWQDWIRYLQQGFNLVNEINKSVTELRKVSDGTESDLNNALKQATSDAKELGSSISNIVSLQADWARLGYSIPDAEKLAKTTQLYVNVGDNMSTETASENLISTLQGFQLDANKAESIIDKFNEVANHYAIDTQGIGEALKRSAASFNAANTSLSESIALVTTANAVVQDPDSIGTTFKTLSARIRGAETELQNLGEETDEYTKTTSKLRDLVKSLTGFDIMEDENTFKSIYDILLGIGKEWSNLTDLEQSSLGEALAGKRNANVLYSVMQNIDQLEDVYKTAENSAGSAQKEQENYQKSIQYSIDVTKAKLEELANDFLSSDFLKGAIDAGGKFIDILDGIVNHVGILRTAFIGLAGYLTAKNANKLGYTSI